MAWNSWVVSELANLETKEGYWRSQAQKDLPLYNPGPGQSPTFSWKNEQDQTRPIHPFEATYGIGYGAVTGFKGWEDVTLRNQEENSMDLEDSMVIESDVPPYVKVAGMPIGIPTSVQPARFLAERYGHGVLGLGFPVQSGRNPSFFQSVASTLAAPKFTVKFPYGEDGDVRFGYEDSADFNTNELPLQQSRNPCGTHWCLQSQPNQYFLVDTGTEYLSLPKPYFDEMIKILRDAGFNPIEHAANTAAGPITSVYIPCDKVEVLKTSALRWTFHLGERDGITSRNGNAFVGLKHLVYMEGAAFEHYKREGSGFCPLRVIQSYPHILGLPFFNTNWVSFELGGNSNDATASRIRWAPQRY